MNAFFWADIGSTAFNALVQSMTVFLFASGLALVLGVLRILNFAHGGFFMVGAYVAYSLLQPWGQSVGLPVFVAIVATTGMLVGLMGVAVEWVLFRRLRNVDEHYALIGTYALLLATEGIVKVTWGVNYLAVPVADELQGAFRLGHVIMPWISIFVIVVGLVSYALLNHLLHHTAMGKLMQSVASDPWMANALGVNVPRIYAAIVVIGFALAGLAGALLSPTQALSPALANGLVLPAFGALIVGGMGNVRGTFYASILLCTVDAFGSVYLHQTPGIIFFFAVCIVLAFRPRGLISGAHI